MSKFLKSSEISVMKGYCAIAGFLYLDFVERWTTEIFKVLGINKT